MYLSKVTVKKSYATRNAFRDAYKRHQFVMTLFGALEDNAPRESENILWRYEEKDASIVFLVSSEVVPSLDNIRNPTIREASTLESKPMSEFVEKIAHLPIISYAIEVNPTRRESRSGKTIPLTTDDEIQQWWDKKLHTIGLERHENDIVIEKLPVVTGFKQNGKHRMTFSAAKIVGRATVLDPEKVVQAVLQGVGRGKSFGLGMLSISGTSI